jgi:cyclopropane-fatty-acyl-phospholipid synthase
MTIVRDQVASTATPGPRLRSRFTRLLVERLVAGVPVRIRYPDGSVRGGGGPQTPQMDVIRPDALYARLGKQPKIGLGEAYMAGDWSAAAGTDLGQLLTPFAQRLSTIIPHPLARLRGLVDQPLPRGHRNTVAAAQSNVSAHYDLSNEFFAAFLDASMTYSGAFFDAATPWEGQDLGAAQERKIQRILDVAGVQAGTRLLEIGTGWGSLALAAARRGADVTSVTLSRRQAELATARVEAAGLGHAATVQLGDYRTVAGEYDAIVSVEMIEAVGAEYWPSYFEVLDRSLVPGGKVGLQAIVMDHDRMLVTRNSFGWIQKYIFPGGLIPSVRAISDVSAEYTGLRVTGQRSFGRHYAETLRRWRAAFEQNWPAIQTLGFDERFRRMWEFYLAYSEAGFASGYLDVVQLQLTKDAT